MTAQGRVAIVAVVVLSIVALPAPGHGGLLDRTGCPTEIDESRFASTGTLRAGTQVMADAGPRPTASPAHQAFTRWVEDELHAIDGVRVRDLPVTIDRQLETGARLALETTDGPVELPVAGAVPYSQPADGVTAPLLHVPPGTALSAVDVRGRIVVRDAVASSVQYAVFSAVSWFVYDPDLTFDPLGSYERDWLSAAQRIADLEQAQARGAAGIVFVHGLPRDQVQGSYSPYPGVQWNVPGVYLGADEGQRLKQALESGTARAATIAVHATQDRAETKTIVATLPGVTAQRIVIESHTDGMNAVWDNGPIAILALARYFASLPIECRTRTIEFVFTTAHLYLSQAGAFEYAAQLDREYEDGSVALVVALEHLGAREYVAAPRSDGPGRRLEQSGESEMFAIFAMESPVLVGALIDRVVARDLRRSFVLRGADAPQVTFPPHKSFGGEGGPYREHLVPTIAAITGPWTLFDPAFGMELVDVELMRRQAMAFGDVVLTADDVPKVLLAGLDPAYRLGRDLTTPQASRLVLGCELRSFEAFDPQPVVAR